jgi:hypothetical protein
MPDRWMTVAAAAASLNVHTRTIERRIAGGKIDSRRADDGQLQVCIDVPDMPVASPDPLETVRELAHDQVSLATGSASAIVRLAQADADRARGELDLVRQDAGRARQSARIAWMSVASMAAAICVAVGWTTFRITQSREQIRALEQRSQAVENESRELLAQRDAAKRQAEAALISSAEASGRLAAYQEQARLVAEVRAASSSSDKSPTSRPLNLAQRIASVMAGE